MVKEVVRKTNGMMFVVTQSKVSEGTRETLLFDRPAKLKS